MKLMWFHLMPYTELPEDFREKHPSVWVDIHSSLFDPRRAHHMYNDFMDELEFAAESGFDAVCVNEHHSNGYGLMPSPNLVAAALSRRTTDTALCVMGNSLALYNPPTRVAEEFAMIDCISGGRLIAGFPVGTPMDTCFAYGQNPSLLRQRYLEAHDLVMRAWTESETFAWNGRFNQQRYVNIWPRPVQQPHPPVWIPGGGSVETWRWCAEMDYVYAYLSYFGYKAGRATMQGFWDEMTKLGKDRNPYRAGFLQFVGVAENRDEAFRLYREPAEYFYGRCLHVDARFANPPGYTSEATMRAGVQSQVAQAAQASAPPKYGTKFQQLAREMDAIVDKGYVIIGSPDEVADRLRQVAHDLNVGHLMLLLQFGNMGKDLAAYNTRLFAERVLPQLRPLFSEWEDRWWPQPIERDLRAPLSPYQPPAIAAA
jgi:alkanesulfonate monooxygenase SsuD/methylene tetrahydromethanopterin reductase-like flavin-dependent oxidoreductase (luciferase family)